MSQKALDIFFRYKFLILLPVVILVLAGAVASQLQQETVYSSSAKIWVQRTPLLTSRLGDLGRSGSPAARQAAALRDQLSLQSFRLSVASRVDALAGLPPEQQAAAVRQGTSVSSSGRHILTIRHVDEDPALTQAIDQAIIDTYSETFATEVVEQADLAESFYEERLVEARQRLDESTAALNSYQETISLEDESDLQLQALVAEVDAADADYNAILDRLENINLERDAALSGRDLSFRLMDPPELPTNPLGSPMRDLLLLPFLGLLLGISVSGVVFFGLIRLDGAVRLPVDTQRIGVPLLAVVPDLGRRRHPSWPQRIVRLIRRRPPWPRHFVRLVVAASRGLMGNLR